MEPTRAEVCFTLAAVGPLTLNVLFRNYPLKKIQENNESEIMQTVLEDARESYAEEIVVELQSQTTEDLENNVNRIIAWMEAWQKNQTEETT
jgi:adenylate kinase